MDSLPQGDDSPERADDGAREDKNKAPRRAPLLITFERKGRAGKQATIISGFADDESDDEIEQLASDLKRALGTGGSARGGEILIQGDRRADVRQFLTTRGRKVKG